MNLAYLVPLFPLIGFLINGLLRKSLNKPVIGVIGSGVILASFVVSVLLFLQVKATGGETFSYFNFISVGKLSIPFAFQIDQLSSVFLLIITGIGFLIHVYSIAYMHDEPVEHFGRFFSYLNLFVFSMLLLVMGANFVIMFIGWEGVGLCSYLLIGFWFKNNNYNYAARKAFVMNRIGDLGFLLAIFWIAVKLGTVGYNEVFSLTDKLTAADITGITLLLFVGAAGKSAQIPLYTWLPDAMAGPTPVSALIHAATMVTAGIYMIARNNILYTLAPFTQSIIAVVGLATALLAASIALKQNDIKKVLAYSTVSQLGYMMLGLGVGAYTGAVFHVMTHAFFKACLFLGAGSVIHAVGGNQDMRTMGGLKKYMPVTHLTFLLSCFAIAGVPPFSGFFSKDEILAAAYNVSPVYYWLGVGGALLTAFYMFRLYAGTFLGTFRGTHEEEHHLHESPKTITIPLVILALLAVVGGFVGIPEVFAKDAHPLSNFLAPVFAKSQALQHAHEANQSTELMLMAVSTVLIIAMIVWAWTKYSKWKSSYNESAGFAKVLEKAWHVDDLYNAIIVKPVLNFAAFLKNVVEKSGIDGIVNGVGRFIQYASRQLRLVQNGQVGNYFLLMVLSIVLLFLVFWNQAVIANLLHKIF
ncbi:MAG: NADH-quinone oxidoreductase subunit L [Chitinophagaceae bacterium]|nr:NADH-quinone oxidoreductase subunit L [Chitinophagaceae bacterium]